MVLDRINSGESKKHTTDNFKNYQAAAYVPDQPVGQTMYITSDGKVIREGQCVRWIAEETSVPNGWTVRDDITRTMTAEIVDAAKCAYDADRRLAEMLAKRAYELDQAKK